MVNPTHSVNSNTFAPVFFFLLHLLPKQINTAMLCKQAYCFFFRFFFFFFFIRFLSLSLLLFENYLLIKITVLIKNIYLIKLSSWWVMSKGLVCHQPYTLFPLAIFLSGCLLLLLLLLPFCLKIPYACASCVSCPLSKL